jgi:hypothetical protein
MMLILRLAPEQFVDAVSIAPANAAGADFQLAHSMIILPSGATSWRKPLGGMQVIGVTR